jgi:hypothetical protein
MMPMKVCCRILLGLSDSPAASESIRNSLIAASDEPANLALVALLHAQQPLASFAVGAMLGGKSVKHGKDSATYRVIG